MDRRPPFDPPPLASPAGTVKLAALDARELNVVCMALAELSLAFPNFEGECRCVAGKFEPDARPLFDALREWRSS